MPLTQLNHVTVRTDDLEATRDFYNEALGSVSQISVYDRVRGRKGAVPDDTVGAHSGEGGH